MNSFNQCLVQNMWNSVREIIYVCQYTDRKIHFHVSQQLNAPALPVCVSVSVCEQGMVSHLKKKKKKRPLVHSYICPLLPPSVQPPIYTPFFFLCSGFLSLALRRCFPTLIKILGIMMIIPIIIITTRSTV